MLLLIREGVKKTYFGWSPNYSFFLLTPSIRRAVKKCTVQGLNGNFFLLHEFKYTLLTRNMPETDDFERKEKSVCKGKILQYFNK